MRRTAASLALAACATAALALPGVATSAAFPVNPGPITKGKPITGSGQNLAPMNHRSWDQGASVLPQVSWYYDSGTAARDQQQVTSAARTWINRRIRQRCTGTSPAAVRRCKVAVVFDLDDTLLSTWPYARAADPPLSFNPTTWNAFVQACGYAPNPAPIALLNTLLSRGVHVAIVSGGSAANTAAEKSCLRANGVRGWSSIRLRPANTRQWTAAQWKVRQRMAIEARGFTIVASIGDQVSDMSWGHLEHGFLLPNVMAYLA